MEQEMKSKKRLYAWIWRPLLVSIILGFFCAWINDDSGGLRDRAVLIASLFASFILIFPSYFIIQFLGAKHKILKTIFILLVFFIGVPIVAFFSATTPLFRTNMLNGAVLYNGPMPEPQAIAMPNGEIMSWFVGQIDLFTKPGIDVKEVERLVSSVGGTILTKIPAFGFYLIEIPNNFKDSVAKMEAEKFVLEVTPNFMIVPAGDDVVDLTDTSKDSRGLVASFLTSPEPWADIITVEIDMFKGSHGKAVNGVREVMGSNGPVLQIDVGGVKCGESYCSSADRVYAALSAVLAGAERNRQKVDVSIALSVMPLTNNAGIFSKKNGEGSNAWATTQWEAFAKGILKIVETSAWTKKGNVAVSQAAGNGACLLDKNNTPLDCVGIDLSKLMLFNLLAENSIYLYGVEEKGKPASYSNHGKDVIMKEIPEGSQGTSIAAAQGWAETEKVWKANPRLGSKEIKAKLTTVVCPNGLQVCQTSCIPTNAECCNDNVYCVKPGGSCSIRKKGTCSICPVGQKFCGMFCVDIAKECQKEVTTDESIPSTKSTQPAQSAPAKSSRASNQKTLTCNGTQWSACDANEQFYCPAKGDPFCGTKGKLLCNGEYWNGCGADEEFQCFPEGGTCVPVGVTLTPLCKGKRTLPCEAGSHFVCGDAGGRCDLDEVLQTPSPSVSPPEKDYSCVSRIEPCRAVCRNQGFDVCSNGCPTRNDNDPCYNGCFTQLDACYAACDEACFKTL